LTVLPGTFRTKSRVNIAESPGTNPFRAGADLGNKADLEVDAMTTKFNARQIWLGKMCDPGYLIGTRIRYVYNRSCTSSKPTGNRAPRTQRCQPTVMFS
jgi:hypothetical protein